MEEYIDVADELNEEIERNITDDMDQADIDQLTEEVYAENVGGEFWKINPDKIVDLNLDFLREKCERDPEEFIDKYCEKE
jgi:hypothetical protein